MTAENNIQIGSQDRVNWVKVKEVAAATGLSQTKIRNLIEEGVIAASRLGNGYYRVQRTELERFIAEGFRNVGKKSN